MKMSIKILAAKKAKKQVSFRAFFKKNMYFCTEKIILYGESLEQ